MAEFSSFGAWRASLGRLSDDLRSAAATSMAHAAGKRAKEIAASAASADLGGDPKFSGWAPTLDVRYDLLDDGVLVKPTRRSAGPWTVAEFGRNSAAGPRLTGPRLTKTGKMSKARAKRWNGRTVGKGTASDALAAMEREMPRVLEQELRRVIRKHFD